MKTVIKSNFINLMLENQLNYMVNVFSKYEIKEVELISFCISLSKNSEASYEIHCLVDGVDFKSGRSVLYPYFKDWKGLMEIFFEHLEGSIFLLECK